MADARSRIDELRMVVQGIILQAQGQKTEMVMNRHLLQRKALERKWYEMVRLETCASDCGFVGF